MTDDNHNHIPFPFISVEDIQKQITDNIILLANNFKLDPKKCLLLLQNYNWNERKLIHFYYNDATYLNKTLFSPNDVDILECVSCCLCKKSVSNQQIFSLNCGHSDSVCILCWIGYLQKGIETQKCSDMTCPAPHCNIIIPFGVWKLFLSHKCPSQYQEYIALCQQHFISNDTRYCTCTCFDIYQQLCICEMIQDSPTQCRRRKICNKCGYIVCWSCTQISQLSLACESNINRMNWSQKYINEIETILWILTNCKRCPKCHFWVEKNGGGIRMTCRKHSGGCGYEWDWLCRGRWMEHGSNTGGYYQCFSYDKVRKEGKIFNDEHQELLYYYKMVIRAQDTNSVNNIDDASFMEWFHKLKRKNSTFKLKIENIGYDWNEIQRDFIVFQSFSIWIHKYYQQREDYFERDFLRNCLNFKSANENLRLFMSGYVRRECIDFVHIPSDIIEYFIVFLYNSNEKRVLDNNIKIGYVRNRQWTTLKTIPAKNMEFIDEWTCPDSGTHMSSAVSLSNYNRKIQFKVNYTDKYRWQSNLNTFGKFGVNCIRKIWKIKVINIENQKDIPCMFKVGINAEEIGMNGAYLLDTKTLRNNLMIKSGDIISILFIYFEDRSVILKFALNDIIPLKQEIIGINYISDNFLPTECQKQTLYRLVLIWNQSCGCAFEIVQ